MLSWVYTGRLQQKEQETTQCTSSKTFTHILVIAVAFFPIVWTELWREIISSNNLLFNVYSFPPQPGECWVKGRILLRLIISLKIILIWFWFLPHFLLLKNKFRERLSNFRNIYTTHLFFDCWNWNGNFSSFLSLTDLNTSLGLFLMNHIM